MTFELFGIVKGQPIQSLAVCSKLEIAEYHKDNTFGDFAGRVIIQESEKTQSEDVQAIFDINAPIFQVEATMSATDWETLKCDITQTTAIELYDAGILHNVDQLNRVELHAVERKKLKASMFVLETSGQPFHSLFSQMQEEILLFLTKGATAPRKRGVAEEHKKVEVLETPVVEPIIEETPVVEPIIEETPVVEPIVEETPVVEPIIEETPVVEPIIEETPVVEPIIEETPVVEPIIEETPVVEPIIEETPVVEPIIEETSVVEPIVTEMNDFTDEELAKLLEDLPVDGDGLNATLVDTLPQVELPIEPSPVTTGIEVITDDLLVEDKEFDVDSFEALLSDV